MIGSRNSSTWFFGSEILESLTPRSVFFSGKIELQAGQSVNYVAKITFREEFLHEFEKNKFSDCDVPSHKTFSENKVWKEISLLNFKERLTNIFLKKGVWRETILTIVAANKKRNGFAAHMHVIFRSSDGVLDLYFHVPNVGHNSRAWESIRGAAFHHSMPPWHRAFHGLACEGIPYSALWPWAWNQKSAVDFESTKKSVRMQHSHAWTHVCM